MLLSAKQIEILELLVRGLAYKQIAHRVQLGTDTVKLYMMLARNKNAAGNNEQLVAFYTEWKSLKRELRKRELLRQGELRGE